MSKKTTVKKPAQVQQKYSTDTPPHALSDEDLMKFVIGLRLLGEERAKRYVTYLQHLRDDPNRKAA